MPPIPKPVVLAAVDFSPASRKALEMAKALALDLGARVRLVHALSSPGRGLAVTVGQAARRSHEAALAEYGDVTELSTQWASGLRQAGLEVEVATPEGPPAEAILQEAAASGAALVAMGTEGAGGLRRFLLGSVAQEVIRRSPVPVLVAPERLQPGFGRGRKGKGPSSRPVLVALDLSEASRLPLTAGAALARDLGVPLRLLHTVHLPYIGPPFPEANMAAGAASALDDEQEAFHELTALAEPLRQQGLAVGACVRVGDAATAILSDAESHGASLVVVGTRQKSGARRLLLGSVAQGVVRASDRPVLVVPTGPWPGKGRGKAAA